MAKLATNRGILEVSTHDLDDLGLPMALETPMAVSNGISRKIRMQIVAWSNERKWLFHFEVCLLDGVLTLNSGVAKLETPKCDIPVYPSSHTKMVVGCLSCLSLFLSKTNMICLCIS